MTKETLRCYIDSNVIIDYVAHNTNAPISKDRILEMDYVKKIFTSATDKRIKLFTSAITKLECLSAGSNGSASVEIKNLFRSILDSGKVIISISASDMIMENARNMHWDGFPLPGNMDKIHIASAIFAECSEIITFDGFKRTKYANSKIEDDACIEELCKQFNISVVHPSESCVAQREYQYYMKALQHAEKIEEKRLQAEASERMKQKQGDLLDLPSSH